jgi:digeranylgeranylglycerophospholipid reductase
MYDVLVIGGGPVGSQAAYRLCTAGYHVAVIEKKTDFSSPVCCTGIVSEECIHKFGIDEQVIYRHVNSASIYSPSGIRIHVQRPALQAAILDRPAFNRYMVQRAQQSGAEYFSGVRITGINALPDMVTLDTELQTERKISGKTAIIATGADISILKNIPLPPPAVFASGAQVEVTINNMVSEVEVYTGTQIAPGYFAWLVPTLYGKALAGLLTFNRPVVYLHKFLDFLVAQGKIQAADTAVLNGAVPVRPSTRTYTDRILVGGTTAGLVKPTTAGGIYYGLLSADIAAAVLQQAFMKGDFSKSSLRQYEQGWKKLLAKELMVGHQARSMYEHLSDSSIDRIFDIMNKNQLAEKLMEYENISFDWHSNAVRHLLQEATLDKLLEGVKLFLPGNRRGKNNSTGEES